MILSRTKLERSIIACCLHDHHFAMLAVSRLTSQDFLNERYSRIFEAIYETVVSGQEVDVYAVSRMCNTLYISGKYTLANLLELRHEANEPIFMRLKCATLGLFNLIDPYGRAFE